MTATNDDDQLDSNPYARAIKRWENEGGALKRDTGKSGAERKVKPTRSCLDVENMQETI